MSERRVLLHCNAGVEIGMGHLMRTVGLAQMAQKRGWSVSVVGDIDDVGIDVAGRLIPGIPIRAARGARCENELQDAAADGTAVIHLDTYGDVRLLAGSPVLVSNMQDGAYGSRPAVLAIDANLGGEQFFHRPDLSTHQLAGIDATVIREQVLERRDRARTHVAGPRVLVVMGGTDPAGLTARVVAALDRIRLPLDVTVIDPRGRPEVLAAALASVHGVRVIGFADDLPAVAIEHDLAVTAAGTSVWDFASLGIPMGLVCAADNQRRGYRQIVAEGLAVGLGEPPHDDLETQVAALADLLGSPDELRRESELLMQAVDGLGAWRIVSAWEQLLDAATPSRARPARLHARDAETGDAQMLFDWRNDEATRDSSRSRDELQWDAHRSWLAKTLADDDRRLLVVESAGAPVATTRWDRRSETDWEVSITVAPDHRGQGLGAPVLWAAEDALTAARPYRMLAGVHVENGASRRLFERAGYLPHLPPDGEGFLTLAKWCLRQHG